jgi:hypothetical protein
MRVFLWVVSACLHAGVIGPGELGCNGRRIGPRDRTWWFSSNAIAIVGPVVPVTAVVTARLVPGFPGPRRYWAPWPLSFPVAPAREMPGKRVACAGSWSDAPWCPRLWAGARRVSVLRELAREVEE